MSKKPENEFSILKQKITNLLEVNNEMKKQISQNKNFYESQLKAKNENGKNLSTIENKLKREISQKDKKPTKKNLENKSFSSTKSIKLEKTFSKKEIQAKK